MALGVQFPLKKHEDSEIHSAVDVERGVREERSILLHIRVAPLMESNNEESNFPE